MAKSKSNTKKDSKSVKKVKDSKKEVKTGRGRPSKKSNKAVAKKAKPVKVEKAVKPVIPVKVEKLEPTKAVKETKPLEVVKAKEKKSPEVVKPKLSETDLLLQNIYGDEPAKDAIPLPVTEQKTQTTTIVSEYDINIQRLPQGVLDLVNSLTSVFNTILQNPLLASNYIADFLDKDTKALNAIKEWVEPRKDDLISYKVKTKGGVSGTQNVSTKVVVNAENIANSNLPSQKVNQPQQNVTHGQNPLVPREITGGGTYQHNIHSNPVHNNPAGNIENKNIHYEMLSQNNHFADVHLQQNPSHNPEQQVVITPQQYIQDYSNGIMATINSYFRMAHSGYIELDSLKSIINGLDKSFGYEIIANGAESFITISKGEDSVTTPKFNIQ